MRHFNFLFILLCLTALLVSCNNVDKEPLKPNIILIYADDLGIGLLGHEGQEIIKTPSIDRLAAEGLRFERAYSNMLCAPARASLITGLRDCNNSFQISSGSAYRNLYYDKSDLANIESSINSALNPIPDEQIFLGQVAKEMGYTTAQFGKLEWGFSTSDYQMKRHGWDYYFGYLDHVRAHGFYPPFLFENGQLREIAGNTLINCGKSREPENEENFKERWDMDGKESYSQTIFMDSILSFIELNKDDPFFLYFPTQLPHGPVSIPSVHSDYENDGRLSQIEKEYASMVSLLDKNVGQILQKLKELDIEKNTIVIFTADNGHEIYYAMEGRVQKPYTNMNTGLRFDNYTNKYYSGPAGDVFNGNGGRAGMKRSNLQGGINVPLIIKWPGQIEEGRSSKLLVANYDLLATIADIVGYSKDFDTDGLSFYKELLERPGQVEHDFIVYSSFTGPTLLTNDGWKIRTHMGKDAFELFFLPDDFREEKDLSVQNPEKLETLKRLLLEACDGDLSNGLYITRNQIAIRSN